MPPLSTSPVLSNGLPATSSGDDLLKQVESLSAAELDTLPFGLIQLDRAGRILKFNQTEAKLARINRDRQLGRNFFDDVAPCTKVREFYGRFVQGLKQRSLYETFGFIFKFDHGWRNVAITMFYSEKTDSVWVLISQTSVTPPPAR
ncbi:PAS domain-containing protein [Stigmatella sp. ncwal1]|uniref:PAS domain-containing protein n=1 Tax=Stigmatella ashevillensis TaxID=2995309 RepID=A0ABT5DN04_9BACT|nr:PAS domain-containing protein [Stigmatella ashevillena]MDC0714979.1 PAS domain-containing protein [Stigmatella ashevillena]